MTDGDATSQTRYKRLDRLAPAGVIVLLYASAALLIQPFEDFPFHDDWTYAWSVEHFLQSGELRFLDWSVHYPIAQVLWGSLFCLPFGFSFSALRVSSVVLTGLGALALYGTLRQLGCRRGESLIASCVLLCNPVVFVLTFSFMTDTFFLSLANIAFYFLVRGFRRDSPPDLWIGCALAELALLVRQVAIAIPGSLLLYVLFARSRRRRSYLLPAAVFCLIGAITPFLVSEIFGVTSQYMIKGTWVVDFWRDHYTRAVSSLLAIFMHVGLALLPVAIGRAGSVYRRPIFWGSVSALALLTGGAHVFSGEIPQPLESMWRLDTLGYERHLMQGTPEDGFLPPWWNYPLFIASVFAFAAVITSCIDTVRSHASDLPALLAWYALGQTVLSIALWLSSDRYSIVLLPSLVILATVRNHETRSGVALLALLYATALLITWNETQTGRAIAQGVNWLRERAVPVAEIDAGYVFNGWNLYAHPENLPSGADPRRDVPYVTSKEKKPYVIAASPIPGYQVLREYSWAIPLRSLNYSIYVLEQLPNSTNKQD